MATFPFHLLVNTGIVVQPPADPPSATVDNDPFFAQWDTGTRISSSDIPWTTHDAFLYNNSKDVAGFYQLHDASTAAYYGDQVKMNTGTEVWWNLRKYRTKLTSVQLATRGMSGPMKIYYIRKGEFNKTLLATIPTGGEGTKTYTLTSPTDVVNFIVECPTKSDFPSEVNFIGTYIAPAAVTTRIRKILFEEVTETNAFFWDFNASDGFSTTQLRTRYKAQHGGMRHYTDTDLYEWGREIVGFSPSNNNTGTWDADAHYLGLKTEGVRVTACIKASPKWKRETWPKMKPGEPAPGDGVGMQHPEQIPVEWQGTFDATIAWAKNPLAYKAQAFLGFQFAARYGVTPVDFSLIKLAPTQYDGTTGQPIGANVKKTALGYVFEMEYTNEPDSFWRGDWSYSTPEMFAAACSAWYDGHMGALGPGYGVKNADPQMKCSFGGLAVPSMEYVMAMIEWCRRNRGYKANGKVNLCWDVVNYHNYSNDGGAVQFSSATTRGKAPELTGFRAKMQYVANFCDEYCEQADAVLGESGFDTGYLSDQRAARPMDVAAGETQANKTARWLVQGQWLMRTALLCFMTGIRFQQYWYRNTAPSEYDRYSTSGVVDQGTLAPLTAGWFYEQMLTLLRGYRFDSIVQETASLIVITATKGTSKAFIYWVPNEINGTQNTTINLSAAGVAHVLSTTSNVTSKTNLSAGNNTVTATETPAIIIVP
jgi:endoglucanase